MASKSKRRWVDPEIARLTEGLIESGQRAPNTWLTSAEIAKRLMELGCPALNTPRLGAYLAAAGFPKKHDWVTRDYYVEHPEEDGKDFTFKRINVWSVVFPGPRDEVFP